jgi:hypothetical protein
LSKVTRASGGQSLLACSVLISLPLLSNASMTATVMPLPLKAGTLACQRLARPAATPWLVVASGRARRAGTMLTTSASRASSYS